MMDKPDQSVNVGSFYLGRYASEILIYTWS